MNPSRRSPRNKSAVLEGQAWFRISNRADDPDCADVYLYDEIGWYGVSAAMFVDQLATIDAAQIDLHVNSPGGGVWDGIAIYNALVNHRATVTTYVDGMAASAASIVAMAGDTILMSQGGQMMIHDAWGECIGNAAEMAKMVDILDHESDNIAGIYASRAGGTAKQWRKAMLEETWYNAAEAVEAGLADRLAAPSAPATKDKATQPSARWDLSIFGYRYDGRDQAPDPGTVTAGRVSPAASTSNVVTDPPTTDPPPVTDDPPADPAPETEPAPEGVEVPDSMDINLSALSGALEKLRPQPDPFDSFPDGIFTTAIQRAANDAPWPDPPPATAEAPELTDDEFGDVLATSIRKAFS